MSYHIYRTKGFILGSWDSKEANKTFSIFTREFGLIHASAQSVRSISSKLRFHLQDLSLADISLVKGKEIWRIVSASGNELYGSLKGNMEHVRLYVRILGLLKRLLHGEEKNERLFDMVNEAFEFLKSGKIPNEQMDNLECILVLKILHNLGYVGEPDKFKHFIEKTEWNESFILAMAGVQRDAIRAINQSLKESHL